MDPLSLSTSFMGIVALGVKISQRFSSFPDVVELRDLMVQVDTTNSLLRQLFEVLETLQGTSTTASESFQEVLAKYTGVLKDTLDVIKNWHLETRRNWLKRPFNVRGILSVSERLTQLNNNLDRLLQAARVQELNRLRQEKYRQSAEEAIKLSLLIAPYTNQLSERQRQFLGKITFSLGTNYYLHLQHPLAETHGSANDSIHHHDRVASDSTLLREVLDEEIEPLTLSARDKDQLRLFVCGIVIPSAADSEGLSLQQSSNHIPFQKVTFIQIMQAFGLPAVFFQMIFTGTATAIRYQIDEEEKRIAFLYRAPLSSSENWTLAISWDPAHHACTGVIHGLLRKEVSDLHSAINDARKQSCHPLLVPLLLCQLLVDGDANGIRRHATDLYKVEFKTNFHGFSAPKSEAGEATETPGKSFEDMTRSLNYISSRLAFHEMRVNANLKIMSSLIQDCKDLVSEANDDDFKKTKLVPISKWLLENLEKLRNECQGLLLEVACNQKIAQSQLEIVYNLVAQRDNKDNLKMAKISADIAAVTKDDSFAMRTIAVMSITFLPGTFVASFFSMSMFNWQAAGTDPVLSSRFWIYWAVTLPLTLLVFSVWFFWLHQHKKHEPRSLNGVQFLQTRTKLRDKLRLGRRIQSPGRVSQGDTEGIEIDTESRIRSTSSGIEMRSVTSGLSQRTDTLVQGPRR